MTPHEKIGRRFTKTTYLVHSRRMQNGHGQGWYGHSSGYRTLEEAQKAIESVSEPLNLGGLTIEFGGDKEEFEYRIVKQVSECEVIHLERRII